MKVVKKYASVELYPVDPSTVYYDTDDMSYVVQGQIPSIRQEENYLFNQNPSKVVFIVYGQFIDEPQIEVQDSLPLNRFYVRGDLESIEHGVFMAYSNGPLGTKTKPLYLSPNSLVEYYYNTGRTRGPSSSYQILKPNMPTNSRLSIGGRHLVVELSK